MRAAKNVSGKSNRRGFGGRAQRPGTLPSPHRRKLAFELLEDRVLLSVAQDLANSIAPYQSALTTVLNAATQLPLVGQQLTGLADFATILQNTEAQIASQTQGIATNGPHQITVALPSLTKTFGFNLGLDAFLQATATGNVQASINPTLYIGFDYNNGAVSLDVAKTHFDIGFGLALPGFQGTFSFNHLLYTKAVDAGTNFNGTLAFNFLSSNGLEAHFTGNAHVLMGLSLSFVEPATNASFNPVFRTTLDMNWGFGASNQLAAPSIQLVNMGLEADSFLHGFVGDIVKTVQKFTKPMLPFIDFLQTPVPIVSAFGSHETIGSLLEKGSGVSQEQQDRFELMMRIITTVNTIDLTGSTGGAVIPFGTITLTGNSQVTGGFDFDTSALTTAIDDIINNPAFQAVEDVLKKVGDYSGLTSTAGFQFPLLEDPQSVIGGMLLKQTKTMFSFSTGRQHFELAPSIGVGIKNLFGVFLQAGAIFDANLSMGYDTAGLIAVAQNPSDVSKLLHGFYFDNSIDAAAPPIPNHAPVRQTGLYVQGLMELSGSAIATLSGGLYANIDVELVNTHVLQPSPHVYLDTIVTNLAGGGKVFDLSGKVYASADISLTFPNPVGPDITLFDYNLAYDELLNFDPPPPPDFGVPVTVKDLMNQHTLLLDVNKMAFGSRITVQPFHDLSVDLSGNIVEADGIRVDYPNEIYLYVERKNDLTTNYYNLIGLNGAVPDGVSIQVTDPFRVFYDEGAPNPSPAQTKPGVLLVGGKNEAYKYSEAADGSQAKVLLVGGYGSNTLTGGTMTFGNFIPGDRIAQAKTHFADTSGYDGAGLGLVNSVIDAAIAPANPAGIIGATMTGSRGGLMFGGPGNNSFFAAGAGAYEMIGGNWVNTFNISPSFSGVPATYQVDGGPGGDSSLTVRVPAGDSADFENGTVPDKYHPTYKALDIYSNAGLFATAHGIQKVVAVGSPGSTIAIGDTSELNIDFKVMGSGTLKFGGSPASDHFDVTAEYAYYGTRNHRQTAVLVPFDYSGYSNPNDFANGIHDFQIVYSGMPIPPGTPFVTGNIYGGYVDGPFYTITRTFGTNGRTQSIQFNAGDSDSSSIALDGRGAADDYHIAVGLGNFFDITVNDSDATTQNTLLVDTSGDVRYHQATLSDNSLHLEYYVPLLLVSFPGSGTNYNHVYLASVAYSPTIFFGANTDIAFAGAGAFQQTIVNRPTAPQTATIRLHGGSPGTGLPFTTIGLAYDPEQPNAALVSLVSAGPTFDIQSNAGNLSFDSIDPLGIVATFNVNGNTGMLSFAETQIWGGSFDTYNVNGNSGTINVNYIINGSYAVGGYVQGLSHVVNVRANTGTINLHDVFLPGLIPYGIDAQINVGDNGSLAAIHGTIILSHATIVFPSTPNNIFSIAGRYGLLIDDRNNPGVGGPWTIDSTKTRIGDLTINYQSVNTSSPYLDTFSRYQAFAKSGSSVTFFSDPTFYIKNYNGGNFPTLQLSAPSSRFDRDGDAINVVLSASGNQGLPVTYAASNLPPGLSINQTTGAITGTIAAQAYLASPYASIVTASTSAFTRGRTINWFVSSGITISVSNSNNLLGHEGMAASLGPFTTTNRYNQPVTLSVTGLPPGLSFNPATASIGGVIDFGAAQNTPYHVVVHATDGTETAALPFDWRVTAITLVTPSQRTSRIGDNENLAIQATSVAGLPLTFSAQNLPVGLSIDPATGVITGVVGGSLTSPSTFHPNISVTQGNDIQSATFSWIVLPAGLSDFVDIAPIGTQTSREGENLSRSIGVTSSLGLQLQITAQGLPPGLKLNTGEGYSLNGKIAAGAASGSPYHVTLTATDGLFSDQVSFDWIVKTAGTVNVSYPGTQYAVVNTAASLAIQASSTLSQTLTYSAAGLPNGLSINPQTGVISGTVSQLAALPSFFDVSVTVTDGTSTYGTTFLWTVTSAQQNVIQLPNPTGAGTITIASPSGTVLTAAVTPISNPAPPGSLAFPFGFISFTVAGQYPSALPPGGTVNVIITLPTATTADGYFRYGATPANPSNHWYKFLYQQQTDGDNASTTGAVIQANGTIVLHLVDGGRGDDDLAMNGVIYDIGGLATGQLVTLAGDYNQSGTVDPADYTVWTAHFGQMVTPFTAGDGNGNGVVDAADYTVWRDHLGAMGSGSGSGASSVSSGPGQVALHVSAGVQQAIETAATPSSIGLPATFDVAGPRAMVASVGLRSPAHDSALAAARRDDGLLAWLATRIDHERGRRERFAQVETSEDRVDALPGPHEEAFDLALETSLAGDV